MPVTASPKRACLQASRQESPDALVLLGTELQQALMQLLCSCLCGSADQQHCTPLVPGNGHETLEGRPLLTCMPLKAADVSSGQHQNPSCASRQPDQQPGS